LRPGADIAVKRSLDSWAGFPPGAAHRGGAAEARQNSFDAIARTAALGFWLETDVSVGPSDVPVLLHPHGLSRVLTHRRLASEGGAPQLEEALLRYPTLPMMIDVKHWPAVMPTAHVLAETGAVDRVVISTFSRRRTRATAAAILELSGKRVRTGLSARDALALVTGHGRRIDRRGPRLLSLPHRLVTPALIEAAHRWGIWTAAWTVNDAPRMAELLDAGIDVIITDRPTLLQQVMGGEHDAGREI
jgi:glycerophosphoryl diester phosphodiesterase